MDSGKQLENLIARYARNYELIGLRTHISLITKREIDILLYRNSAIYIAAAHRTGLVETEKVITDIEKIKEAISLLKEGYKRLQVTGRYIFGVDYLREKDYNVLRKNKREGNFIINIGSPSHYIDLGEVYIVGRKYAVIKKITDKEQYKSDLKLLKKMIAKPKIYYVTNNGYTRKAISYMKKNNVRYFTLDEWRRRN